MILSCGNTNMNKLSLILIILSFSSFAIEKEAFYSNKFCSEMSGKSEHVLKDLSRVDCLTDTHAYEFDWADGMKVYEAIGQSLYYASETGKEPGIYLLIRKKNSEKHIRKVRRVIETFNLPIKLVIKDIRN
jgi:hypothetical protein